MGIAVLLLSLLLSAPVSAADELLQMMLDKARYLQSLGKSDQSAEAWRKVLVASPGNREALLWLGMSEAYAGNRDSANEYAERFAQAGGKAQTVEALRRAIKMGPPDAFQLDRARKLAQSGNAEEAVAAYKKAFRQIEPSGHLALEYYQTLSAVPDAWESSRAGLQRLVEEFPEQPIFQHAYARHLSYRESSRREAIRRLERLASDRTVGKQAQQDLRQAVVWLQVGAADERLLNRLAKKWPNDKAITKKRKELNWQLHGPDDRDRALKAVYRALKEEDLSGAEEQLKKLYKKGKSDADVLAAMGLLRQKQERFDEAVEHLERAIKLAPENRKYWGETLASARYWALVRRAERLKEENNLKEAELVLRKALAIKPAEIAPRNALADVLAKLGRPEKAKEFYEEVLKRDPGNVDARFGLVFVLVELGERQRALQLANEVTKEYPEKGVAFAHIQAQEFAEQALDARNEDVQIQARLKLENMLAIDPANPWIRLDLARVYRLQGEREEARSLLDGLLVSHPDLPAALYARALLHEEEQEFDEGLRVLEKIPPQSRSFDMRKLQNRLWVRVQTQRAQIYADQGQIDRAREILEQVTPIAEAEDEFIGPVAKAWFDIGEMQRALSILRLDKSDDTDLKFLYLTVLLSTGQNAEVELVMAQLERSELTPAQRQALDDIYIGYSIKRANQARERGDFARAYEYLGPLRAKYPDNTDVVVALGTLHAAVGDSEQAFGNYVDVLAQKPNDLAALSGAVGIAMQVRDYEVAMTLAKEGVELEPDSAQAHALLGRVYRAMEDDERAVRSFEQALQLETGSADIAAATGERRKPRLTLHRLKRDDYLGAAEDSVYMSTASVLDALRGDGEQQPQEPAESDLARQLRTSLEEIYARHSPSAKGGLAFRYRDGQEGLDRLTNLEVPLEYAFSPKYKGRLTLRATPVLVDAGNISSGDLATLRQFGSNGAVAAPLAKSVAMNDSGLALSADYDTRQWHMDLGVTPLGFTQSSVVGGLRWQPVVGPMQVAIGFTRHAVTQSVLSYAGARDTATGRTWGGVIENSVELSGGYDLSGLGVYGTLSYGSLNGKNVASNNKFELSAGFYKDLVSSVHSNVKAGLHVTALGYQRNLSYFSYGHGGYFSPRYYLSISVPVSWVGYNGPLSYQLGGSIGIHSFGEDDADYFPNNRDMQEQLELVATSQPDIGARYRGVSDLDFNYGLNGNLEYGMNSRLSVGVKMAIAKAKDYKELSGLLYVSFWTQPQRHRTAPAPVVPFYIRDNYD